MTELPDVVKHALGVHIAADLEHFGGVLRCGTCGAEQPAGDVASHLRSGWPQHCGKTMTWVTFRQLAWEARQPVPEGFELVAAEAGDWQVEAGRRCRRLLPGRRGCGIPAAAALNRRRYLPRNRFKPGGDRVDSWWGYCLEHMASYGNWIEDGQVMHWILREVKDGA